VEYIESAFGIRVKKIICKFVLDIDSCIYFIGVKELLIFVHSQGKLSIICSSLWCQATQGRAL